MDGCCTIELCELGSSSQPAEARLHQCLPPSLAIVWRQIRTWELIRGQTQATRSNSQIFFNAFVQENDLFTHQSTIIDIFVESADLTGGYIARQSIVAIELEYILVGFLFSRP